MQTVLCKQITARFTEFGFGNKIGRRSACQNCLPSGNSFVEEIARIGDDRRAAGFVIAAGLCRRSIQCICAIKRIIQAAPACIGGVQNKAVIKRRHHQLRPRHRGDFGVDILCTDGKRGGFRNQIANLAQVHLIARHVVNRPRIGLVPIVQLCLQFVAFVQQCAVSGGEACQYIG